MRSISGPFLSSLGATALIIGFFSGLGEFLTYSLRFFSGYIADKKRTYWLFTILGYFLICCLPFLSFVKTWQIAVLLLLIERIGKAVRTPARDTLISFAGKNIGYGKSFGIHEVLDQIGAVCGSLIFFLVLSKFKNYSVAFNLMWIPFFFLLIFLFITRKKYEFVVSQEFKKSQNYQKKLNQSFIFYILFVLFSISGFAGFSLISYHLVIKKIFLFSTIPILYMIAMGVDGIVAPFIGNLYDRIKFKSLIFIPFLTVLLPFFSFSLNLYFSIIGIIIYGVIMGCHETVLRASIADIIPPEKRGMAYGIFNSIYGFGFFISGWIIGFLYEKDFRYIWFYVICTEIISFLCLLFQIKKIKNVEETGQI